MVTFIEKRRFSTHTSNTLKKLRNCFNKTTYHFITFFQFYFIFHFFKLFCLIIIVIIIIIHFLLNIKLAIISFLLLCFCFITKSGVAVNRIVHNSLQNWFKYRPSYWTECLLSNFFICLLACLIRIIFFVSLQTAITLAKNFIVSCHRSVETRFVTISI